MMYSVSTTWRKLPLPVKEAWLVCSADMWLVDLCVWPTSIHRDSWPKRTIIKKKETCTMAPFASLIIRLFQLIFSAGTVFFSHNKSQCFGLFFQRSKRGQWLCTHISAPLFQITSYSILRAKASQVWAIERTIKIMPSNRYIMEI